MATSKSLSFDYSNRSIEHIQPSSKKIKKAEATATVNSQDPRLKKYKTFTKAAKSIIIHSLMNELNFPLNEEVFPRVRFLNYLKVLYRNDKKSCKLSLQKVLTKHVDSDVVSKESLQQWKRKIKDWIKNYEKAETRGGKLVPDDKLEWFKEKLIPILYKLPKKNFELLREHLLPVFEEMHKKSNKYDQPFNSNICSKHFWHDFREQNPDIKELYKAIPLTSSSEMETVTPIINTLETTDISYLISPPHQDLNFTSPFPNTHNAYNIDSLTNEVAPNRYNYHIPTASGLAFSRISYSSTPLQQQQNYPSSAQDKEALDFNSFSNQTLQQSQNFTHSPQETFGNTFPLCPSASPRGSQNESSFSRMVSDITSNNQENQTTHPHQNNMPETSIESVMDIFENNDHSSDDDATQHLQNVSDFLTTDHEEPDKKGTDLFTYRLESIIQKLDSLPPFDLNEFNHNY